MRRALFFFLVWIGFAAPALAVEADATITKVRGDVSVVRDGSTSPAKEGVALKEGDQIKTADGTADFSMNGLAGCRVLADSECQIKDPKKATMLVKLGNGKAVFNLEKLPEESSFKVETPTAVAAVRGTQFSGSVGPQGSTFSVRDDSIEVVRLEGGKPTGEPIVVGEGFSCDVPAEDLGRMTSRPATGRELTAIEQVASVKTCS